MVLLENDGVLPIHTKKVELSEIKSIAGVNAILLMTAWKSWRRCNCGCVDRKCKSIRKDSRLMRKKLPWRH